VNPQNSIIYQKKAWAYLRLGIYEYNHGIDPRDNAKLSINETKKINGENLDNAFIYDTIGNAWALINVYETFHNFPNQYSMKQSILNYRKSIAANPNFAWSWNDLAATQITDIEYWIKRGIYPKKNVEEVIKNFEKSIEIDNGYISPYGNLIYIYSII